MSIPTSILYSWIQLEFLHPVVVILTLRLMVLIDEMHVNLKKEYIYIFILHQTPASKFDRFIDMIDSDFTACW